MALLPDFTFRERFAGERFFKFISIGEYKARYQPQVHQPHTHRYYLLMFITQGSGSHFIDFKEYPIAPDALYCIAPGQVHHLHWSEDVAGYDVLFEEHFYCSGNEADALPLPPPFFRSGLVRPHLPLAREAADFTAGLFQRLGQEYRGDFSGKWAVIRSLLHLLLGKLESVAGANLPASLPKISRQVKLAGEFKQLVEAHYAQHKNVPFYAGRLFVSSNHLTETVRAVTGETPLELIRRRTLLEAKRRLLARKESIKELAFGLGYESSAYFIRLFKQETGFTPAAFREKVKSGLL